MIVVNARWRRQNDSLILGRTLPVNVPGHVTHNVAAQANGRTHVNVGLRWIHF